MDYFVYVVYIVLFVFLFAGAKYSKFKGWNEDVLSLSQTKALQGFCIVCIMLHHIAQKTCASWLPSEYVKHGLEPFLNIGYLMVSVFFFCSGYGLYKSYKNKQNYLEGFFGKRCLLPIIALLTTSLIFAYVQVQKNGNISLFPHPFTFGGPQLYNTYSWYIFAILIFYFGFYIAFRFCKKEKYAVIVTSSVVILYIAFCDWWLYGDWWYNTAILFVIGLLFSKFENKIVDVMKRKYIILCVVSILFFGVTFILAQNSTVAVQVLGVEDNYLLGRWLKVAFQIISACLGVLLLILFNLKVAIGNKAMHFMGAITLEFYLIHGLFVQLFSYCFINEGMQPFYYIKNVTLMVIVVFVLSLVTAVILSKFHKLAVGFLIKYKDFPLILVRDFKKILIVLIGIIIVATIFMSISSHNSTSSMEKEIAKYKENTVYADVNGKKMAAYVVGEGERTIVILPANIDFCSTISLRPLADQLASNNKVIVLDYFGHGFSDDTDRERSVENLVDEVHTALQSLGVSSKYVLMMNQTAGIEGQLYVDTYPDEIQAVIGFDSSCAQYLMDYIRIMNVSANEHEKIIEKQNEVLYYANKVFNFLGYGRMYWVAIEGIFPFHSESEVRVLEEVFLERYNSRNACEERRYEYSDCQKVFDKKFKNDLPVYFMLSYVSCTGNDYYGSDWEKIHKDLLTNQEIQKVDVLQGNQFMIYYNPKLIAQRVNEFLDSGDFEFANEE